MTCCSAHAKRALVVTTATRPPVADGVQGTLSLRAPGSRTGTLQADVERHVVERAG